jgi:hypothetical protein
LELTVQLFEKGSPALREVIEAETENLGRFLETSGVVKFS